MKFSAAALIWTLVFKLNFKGLNAQPLSYEPPSPISCSPTRNCPKEYPCCSQFWTCGTGPVCITGCNPKNSFNNFSCLRGPAFMPEDFTKRRQNRMKTKKDEVFAGENDNKMHGKSDTEYGKYYSKINSYEELKNVERINNEKYGKISASKYIPGKSVDELDSVYIYSDDDQLKEYFELKALRKRNRQELEMLTEKKDDKLNNNKTFYFNNLLVKHKDWENFANSSDKIINSYAGDHMKIDDQEIIPWTEYLIASGKDKAEEQWDNVGFTYSGNIKKVFDGKQNSDGYLYLAMPKRSAGSLLTTTRSMLYGKVGVKLKTGQGRGVITTFVLFSNVHDEIDFEFLGGDLFHAQTNYYYQGELIHTRMTKAYTESNIHDTWHNYEMDWNEERIHWILDGRIVRTLQKVDTWDPVAKIYKYPQTPMKLHVSIWPGGSVTNSPGTIDWAGGLVDWDGAQDMVEKGEFDCKISYISIEPYFNQKMANHQKETNTEPNQQHRRMGYVFEEADNENKYLEKNVKLTNEDVMYLKSTKNTGNSPN